MILGVLELRSYGAVCFQYRGGEVIRFNLGTLDAAKEFVSEFYRKTSTRSQQCYCLAHGDGEMVLVVTNLILVYAQLSVQPALMTLTQPYFIV